MKDMAYAECAAINGGFVMDYGIPHRPAPAAGGLTTDWGDVGLSTFTSTASFDFDAFASSYRYPELISSGGGGGGGGSYLFMLL